MLSLGGKKYWIFKNASHKWKRNFIVDNFMSTQIVLLQMNGQWPINYKRILPKFLHFLNKPLNYFYVSLMIFMTGHLLVCFAITTLKMFKTDATVGQIAQSTITTILYFYSTFSIIYFLRKHKECKELFDYMNQNFKRRSAKALTYITAEPSYELCKKISIIWILIISSGTLQFSAHPLYTLKRILPFPCWYPFDPLVSPNYEFVVFFQVAGQIQLGPAFGNAGNILLSCVMIICGQYDILFSNLRNIRQTAMIRHGKNIDDLKKMQAEINLSTNAEADEFYYSYEQFDDLDDIREVQAANEAHKTNRHTKKPTDTYLMEYNEELTDMLSEYIQHHQMLIKFCKLLADFFSPVILVKSFQITSQICNIAFVATLDTDSPLILFNNIEYMYLTLSELFLYGYAGEWLKYQSTRVGDALLKCPWHLCGGPFRRGILMILTNSVRPMTVNGGNFFILDYDKIKNIIAASFSYYTLLKAVGARQK